MAKLPDEIPELKVHYAGMSKGYEIRKKTGDFPFTAWEAGEIIRRVEAYSPWIPVSEGLPKKTGEYLVFPSQKHCPTLWYQDGWYWYDHQDDAIQETVGYCEDPILEVTHYKPIVLPGENDGKM